MSFATNSWLKWLYRQGPYFQRLSEELAANHALSREEIERRQLIQLQRLIHYCNDNVPYYRDLFRRIRLKHDDIRSIQDLDRIPFLNKHIVKANYDKLIAVNYPKSLCKVAYTSGTTGMPSRFLRDPHSIHHETATIWRYWKRAGDHGKKRVTIRGDLVVPASRSRPPFWRYNPGSRELMMSAYHLSPANSRFYIDKILEFRPAVLNAFPAMAFLLARYFRAHDIRYAFDAVFTSSESLEAYMKDYIEETFQTRVHDWYGQAERVAAMGQCAEGRYHVEEDYSLVELVDAGNGHEIVGTHLNNFAMPLLRYRTGDLVIPSGESCPCGSAWRPVDRIIGRSAGMIITPEGYHIVSAPAFVFKGLESVLEGQFYQEKQGEVTIKVLTRGGLSEPDRETLLRNTREYTSPQMKVHIEEVPAIERGPNGKFLAIVNRSYTFENM